MAASAAATSSQSHVAAAERVVQPPVPARVGDVHEPGRAASALIASATSSTMKRVGDVEAEPHPALEELGDLRALLRGVDEAGRDVLQQHLDASRARRRRDHVQAVEDALPQLSCRRRPQRVAAPGVHDHPGAPSSAASVAAARNCCRLHSRIPSWLLARFTSTPGRHHARDPLAGRAEDGREARRAPARGPRGRREVGRRGSRPARSPRPRGRCSRSARGRTPQARCRC